MRRSHMLTVSCLGLLAACAARGTRGSGDTVTFEECPVGRAPLNGESWRLARGPGFTYCVPTAWRAVRSDSGTLFYGPRGSVSWTRRPGPAVPFVGAGRRGSASSEPNPCAPATTFSETIGGLEVQLSRLECARRFHTSARWELPVLAFTGSADDQASALEHLMIYRTVLMNGMVRQPTN